MKSLLQRFSKLVYPQFVIPAQAGIQVSDMPSSVLICTNIKNIGFSELGIKVSFKKLLVDWIPAYAGMTGLANLEVVI